MNQTSTLIKGVSGEYVTQLTIEGDGSNLKTKCGTGTSLMKG